MALQHPLQDQLLVGVVELGEAVLDGVGGPSVDGGAAWGIEHTNRINCKSSVHFSKVVIEKIDASSRKIIIILIR